MVNSTYSASKNGDSINYNNHSLKLGDLSPEVKRAFDLVDASFERIRYFTLENEILFKMTPQETSTLFSGERGTTKKTFETLEDCLRRAKQLTESPNNIVASFNSTLGPQPKIINGRLIGNERGVALRPMPEIINGHTVEADDSDTSELGDSPTMGQTTTPEFFSPFKREK